MKTKTWKECLSDWGMGSETLTSLQVIMSENTECATLAQGWVDAVRDETEKSGDAGLKMLDRIPALVNTALDRQLRRRGIEGDWTQ